MNLSQPLQISLSVALSEAARLGHEYAGVEHLLYALTLDRGTADVLRHSGANLEVLKRRLAEFLTDELDRFDDEDLEPRLGLGVRHALARASAQVAGSGRDEVRGSDVLVALFAEPDTFAIALLDELGVSRLDVISYLSHGVSRLSGTGPGGLDRPSDADDGAIGERDGGEDDEEGDASPAGDPLKAFCQELTAFAKKGAIDPLIGREREIERTLHILQRRRKNNPIYVGDPGVGKTALVEGLALRIAKGDVPPRFAETRIFRLDLGALLAGTRFRGDFENRLKAVLAALAALTTQEPKERAEAPTPTPATAAAGKTGGGANDRRPILFIDEIHTLIGAGAAGRGSMDASNLLKPALQDGTLRCIGATTWEEYRQNFQRDAALARRFQKVEVLEPSIEETVRILEGLRERYELHHGVTYTKSALRAAAELAARHLHDKRLPDKAIDLLDEAGAAVSLAGGKRVGAPEIERVLSTMAQIPPKRVHGSDRDRLQSLESELKAVVFGQDAAIERLVMAIKVSRAGLREPQKPVGSFLLTGPTGVGKTEMAKQLALTLGISFLRFDMSEYMERHTVSRLVGAPPGYVGYDRGGLLTEAVAKSPHAVLLLDEVEKAHEDVFNLLLQVMDHGTLTDTNGKATDFRHVILLMTSNVGAREMAQRTPGFGATPASSSAGAEIAAFRDEPGASPALRGDPASDQAVERLFSPEFRNRLDARLRFRPLDPSVMEQIVDKMVGELAKQLQTKKVTLEITPEARTLLAQKGYDPAFGARPLGRVIDETIRQPLTDQLLFGKLQNGGKAVAGVVDGGIVVEVPE
ncbi:MAG TPA: AAA family ATPase [Thermoanaerobaculia bacterium]|nr:AAA family ATPase [Thermoanaerobaculia bacterium]